MPLRLINPVMGQGRSFKLGDIGEVRRGYEPGHDPEGAPSKKSVVAIGISMAKGGDIIALGKNGTRSRSVFVAESCRRELDQIQDQPRPCPLPWGICEGLDRGRGGRAGCELHQPGFPQNPGVGHRPGMGVHHHSIGVLAVTFLVMYYWGWGCTRFRWALIISLACWRTTPSLPSNDGAEAGRRLTRSVRPPFAYDLTAMRLLTGTLITVGFLPIGMAQSDVGEYTFAIFAVTAADCSSRRVVSVYFVPLPGAVVAEDQARGRRRRRSVRHAVLHPLQSLPANWCVQHR